MDEERIIEVLQSEWDRNHQSYSEDGFKEYVEEFCEEHCDTGYVNVDGEYIYIVDYVLSALDLTR